MSLYLCIAALILGSGLSLYFSTLTYALRDFSRSKLADYLGRRNGDQYFEALTEQTEQFIFVTAVSRQVASLMIWVSLFAAFEMSEFDAAIRYIGSIVAAAVITLFCTIALPLALAKYAAEPAIGFSAPLLTVIRKSLSPLASMMGVIDEAVRRGLGVQTEAVPEQIEQEIMSAVEEGEKEGVVDEQERELIENVIEFRDATAGQIMTARTDIVALEITANLDEARSIIETSGHSRVPVYDGSLEKIVGILYARDLIKSLGQPHHGFDMRTTIRTAMFVPETKPLRSLLNDFRHQKVHIAVVLDEYGGTAGLVTIEDILEELVGEISDEHEALEPAMFRKTGEFSAEADARLTVAELNRLMGLNIPEDVGYESVGGFLMTTMGRIPEKGAVHEAEGVKYTVLDAEPQKISRVRVEVLQSEEIRGEGWGVTRG
jgi:CBS domain containing-hemolysin-like protein